MSSGGSFDHDLPRGRSASVALAGLLVLALYLASAGLGALSRRIVLNALARVTARLRTALVAHLYALLRSWHDVPSAGGLHAAVVHDTECSVALMQAVCSAALPGLVVSLALSVVALVISPLLFACMVGTVSLALVAICRLARGTRARAGE